MNFRTIVQFTLGASLTLVLGCSQERIRRTITGEEICGLKGADVITWKEIAESIEGVVEGTTLCFVPMPEVGRRNTLTNLTVWHHRTTIERTVASYESGLETKGWRKKSEWGTPTSPDERYVVFERGDDELALILDPKRLDDGVQADLLLPRRRGESFTALMSSPDMAEKGWARR